MEPDMFTIDPTGIDPDMIVIGLNTDWRPCAICGHTVKRGEVAVINRQITRHRRCIDQPTKPQLRLIRGGLSEQLALFDHR
jgi:hypothetical protein